MGHGRRKGGLKIRPKTVSAGEATIGDESTDRLLVVGSTQMQQSLVVDGNVTLGTGINDCSDNSAYCNAMLALESTVRTPIAVDVVPGSPHVFRIIKSIFVYQY